MPDDIRAEDVRLSFDELFWEWFDSLSPKVKRTFHAYPADMARIYFENKVWPIVRGSGEAGESPVTVNHVSLD